MKKLFLAIVILASVGMWQSVDASIKKSSETITVGITAPLDSAGLPGAPDSIQVVAWPDNATTAAYTASITAIDGDQFDTITVGGVKTYVFRDAIADIDGAGGNFELAVFVTAFYKKLPTQSPPYYVQVVSDSLENFLDAPMDSANVIIANLAKGIDSINAILDTLQLYDGRYALASELTKAIDSINAILDTLQLTDTRLDSLLAAAGHTAKVGADQIWSLRGLHIRATGDHDTAIIAQGGDINGIGFYRWGGKYGSYSYGEQYAGSYDTGFAFGAQFGGIVYDIVGDIHGTLTRTDSVGDGGVEAFWNKPYNSSFTAGSMGDSLNNNPFATILAAVNAVPLGTWNIPFTTAFTAGSMGDSMNNLVTVGQMASVFGDTIVARDMATGAEVTAIDPPSVSEIWDTLGAAGTVDNKIDSTLATAYTIFDSLMAGVWGGGGGLDSATVEGAAKAALQAGIDASFGKIHATNLIINANNADTAGLWISNTAGGGATIKTSAAGNTGLSILSSTGHTLYMNATTGSVVHMSNSSSSPTFQVTQSGSGDAVKFLINSGATGQGYALDLHNDAAISTTGGGLRIESSAGNASAQIGNTSNAILGRAFYVYTTGDSGHTFVISNGSGDTSVSTRAFYIEGSSAFTSRYGRIEEAMLIHTVKPGAPALYIYGDSSAAIRASTSNSTYNDMAIIVGGNVSLDGNKFVGDIVGNITGHVDTALVAAWVDTVDYTKDGAITATLSGTGAYTYSLLLLDTTASPDAPINGAEVTIRNLAQTNYIAWAHTNVNGMAYFNLDTGQYAVLAKRAGYYFKTPDTVHLVGVMSDTTEAYVLDIGKVTVSGRIYGMSRDSLRDAKITFSMPYGRVWADVDSAIYYPTDVSAYTDSTGYFSLGVLASTKMFVQTPADTLKYNVSIDYQGKQIQSFKSVVVPDVTSVTFNPTITRR
ncbi:MAG: hypothetical protein WC356_03870 [Candidatus Micrarchaeia archaeon]